MINIRISFYFTWKTIFFTILYLRICARTYSWIFNSRPKVKYQSVYHKKRIMGNPKFTIIVVLVVMTYKSNNDINVKKNKNVVPFV